MTDFGDNISYKQLFVRSAYFIFGHVSNDVLRVPSVDSGLEIGQHVSASPLTSCSASLLS